jgi:beta-glucosidase
VIGPNADSVQALWGNYHGTASRTVTPLAGIRARVSPRTRIWYAEGCKLQGTDLDAPAPLGNLTEAVLVAKRADVSVLVLGLDELYEGEQGDAKNSLASGDKPDLALPGLQQQLLEAVVAVGKPVIVVIVSGGPLDLQFAEQHASAIVQAFYGGEEGGSALADVLFGDVSPSGRLPVTFPRSLGDLPPFEDYALRGRTYRYLEAEPLFPFGYGLSYARFAYSELQLSSTRAACSAELRLDVSVRVTNAGAMRSEEVVQLYVRDLESSVRVPHHELRGFRRIALEVGESTRVTFELDARSLSLLDDVGRRRLEPGRFSVFVGGGQPDQRTIALTEQAPLAREFELFGATIELDY